jgi:hypothetical protein
MEGLPSEDEIKNAEDLESAKQVSRKARRAFENYHWPKLRSKSAFSK